jgi:magnesium transporter
MTSWKDRVGAAAVVGDCGVYENGRRLPGRIPLHEAGDIARHTQGFVWIGLQQASAADIAEVAEEFQLPPLAVEDAIKAHQRPKLEVYDDIVFVVLKPVRYVDHEEVVEVESISLFLGRGFVVTVRHGDTAVLRRVRDELDQGSDLLQYGPSAVLYRAADLVVDGYEEAIDCINEDVDEIEAQVFGPGEDDHAQRIYKLKQEVAEFRRAVAPLARPLERLSNGEVPCVDPATGPYFRDVHDHVLRAADFIEGLGGLLSDVLQANVARVTVVQSQIALRQNEDMRRISAWAAIALVPTAIAGIYGMNFDHMPELRWRYGYLMVLVVIGTACLGLHRLFRRNGWL